MSSFISRDLKGNSRTGSPTSGQAFGAAAGGIESCLLAAEHTRRSCKIGLVKINFEHKLRQPASDRFDAWVAAKKVVVRDPEAAKPFHLQCSNPKSMPGSSERKRHLLSPCAWWSRVACDLNRDVRRDSERRVAKVSLARLAERWVMDCDIAADVNQPRRR